jgi:hypothetical protein
VDWLIMMALRTLQVMTQRSLDSNLACLESKLEEAFDQPPVIRPLSP